MKPLLILGFALSVSFLAPLAQAAPEPAHFTAPAPTVTEDRRAEPPPQAAPEHHEADRPPRGDSVPDAPPVREHHREDTQPVIDVVQAPGADDSQDSAPAENDQTTAPTADSCGNSEISTSTGQYTMDDLANAAASLDAPYDSTHFSMDDVGGL